MWTWRPAAQHDRYAIAPYDTDGQRMPYVVCKVVVAGDSRFEAWHKCEPIPICMSRHQDPDAARAACFNHWEANHD